MDSNRGFPTPVFPPPLPGPRPLPEGRRPGPEPATGGVWLTGMKGTVKLNSVAEEEKSKLVPPPPPPLVEDMPPVAEVLGAAMTEGLPRLRFSGALPASALPLPPGSKMASPLSSLFSRQPEPALRGKAK